MRSPGHPEQLDTAQRGELLARADALAAVAKAGTVEEFSRRLALETKRLQDKVTVSTGWNANAATPGRGRGSTTTACGT
jgi:hypothetical protein